MQGAEDRPPEPLSTVRPWMFIDDVEHAVRDADEGERERQNGERARQRHRYQAERVAQRPGEHQRPASVPRHERPGHQLAAQEPEHRAEQGETQRALADPRSLLDRGQAREDRREQGAVEGEHRRHRHPCSSR